MVEPQIVILVVAGSSPVDHPISPLSGEILANLPSSKAARAGFTT